MGDFTRHEPKIGCTCTTCLLIHTCGIPGDDPMWREVELYANMRVAMCLLVKREPPIGSRHGPWAGERPWLQLWGRALDFDEGAP
jgi:hypothetical protein